MSIVKEAPRELTEGLIGCGITVHDKLGPGFLEPVYHECYALELTAQGFSFKHDKVIPVEYRGVKLNACYRFDFLVEESVIVEIKSVEMLAAVHRAQVINYLKLTGISVGLLMNFNVGTFKDGLRRLEHPDLYRRSRSKKPPEEGQH